MSDSIVRDIAALKLKIMDAFVEKLPESMKDDVKKLQRDFVEALNDATREYLERKPDDKSEEGLKKVAID